MKDLVTKGTGNSRYMKSAIGASETWEQAREKLRNGTFPFDLNGLNEAGIEQMGMALSKQNLLSDETASALGLSGDPTVNDAFDKLADLIDDLDIAVENGVKIAIGSYMGTGTSGSRGRCTLTFDFAPKMVLVYSPLSLESQAGSTSSPLILISPNNGITQGSTNTQSTQWGFNRATWSVNSVSWYADNAEHQKNMSPNYTYVYFAIG